MGWVLVILMSGVGILTNASIPTPIGDRLGLRPNMIRSDHPTLIQEVRVHRQEHGRRFRTVYGDFEPYANEYCPLLSMVRT